MLQKVKNYFRNLMLKTKTKLQKIQSYTPDLSKILPLHVLDKKRLCSGKEILKLKQN